MGLFLIDIIVQLKNKSIIAFTKNRNYSHAMADFIFIRHAESNNNQLAATRFPKKEDRPEFLKWREANPELSADGRGQTAIVAKRIVKEFLHQEHNGSVNDFTPKPVSEIWCSYLTRAIETAVAIQEAWREAAAPSNRTLDTNTPDILVPPIRIDSDATEVGGHYQYDHDLQQQQGTPGFTNKEVSARWPNATFIFEQKDNENNGWNKLKTQEPKTAAEERASRLVKKMENVASASAIKAEAKSDDAPAVRPTIIVITHGDFFRYVLQSIAGRAPVILQHSPSAGAPGGLDTPLSPLKAAGGVAGNADETLPQSLMPSNRICCDHIISRASVKQNIGNTSLSHFGITVIGAGSDAPQFEWRSAFMDDNTHVIKDASQAAALKRFEEKGKTDFEDPETK